MSRITRFFCSHPLIAGAGATKCAATWSLLLRWLPTSPPSNVAASMQRLLRGDTVAGGLQKLQGCCNPNISLWRPSGSR